MKNSAFLIYMTSIKLGRFGINITVEINVVSRLKLPYLHYFKVQSRVVLFITKSNFVSVYMYCCFPCSLSS